MVFFWPMLWRWPAVVAGLLSAGVAHAQTGEALQAKYESMKPTLARSPFQRPLLLESGPSSKEPHGEVYAVVDSPFSSAAPALQRAEHWCDMLILPFNIKRCVPTGDAGHQVLQVAVGRKSDQPVADAYNVQFSYAVRAAASNYLSVRMAAPEGPLGTSDYRLGMEAVPINGGQQTFVHLSYSYASGFAARLATDAYLATAGRSKVGFSVVDPTGDDDARYVGGIQGVAERNTMRYFLAIEAFLKTMSAPEDQQVERRLREWFAATERYPRQLREMPLDEYLAMKRREVRAQELAGKT